MALSPPDSQIVSPPASRRRAARLIAIIVSLVFVLISGVVASLVIVKYAHARPLECLCGIGWYAEQDVMSSVPSAADGHEQSTINLRPNARQGFYVVIVNRSSVTQAVTGLPSGFLGPYGGSHYHLEVSTRSWARAGRDWTRLSYSDRATIAPGADRVLRLTWTSPSCFDKGLQVGIDSLRVRVRVGAFTRTENISLHQEMALSGTGNCGGNS